MFSRILQVCALVPALVFSAASEAKELRRVHLPPPIIEACPLVREVCAGSPRSSTGPEIVATLSSCKGDAACISAAIVAHDAQVRREARLKVEHEFIMGLSAMFLEMAIGTSSDMEKRIAQWDGTLGDPAKFAETKENLLKTRAAFEAFKGSVPKE